MEKGRHRVSFHYEFGGVSRESLVEIYTQLWRTEDVKTSDVGVFAVHMVGEYDDLQYITINRFAVPASQTTESEILIEPLQLLAFFSKLCRNVERYPAVWFVKIDHSDILQVAQARPSPQTQR